MANIENMMAADMAATAFDLTDAVCPADSMVHTDQQQQQTTVAGIVQSLSTIDTDGPDEDGLSRQRLITVNIPVSQLPAVVVNGDTLTIDGNRYRITEVNRHAALWEITAAGGEVMAKYNNEQFRKRWGQ